MTAALRLLTPISNEKEPKAHPEMMLLLTQAHQAQLLGNARDHRRARGVRPPWLRLFRDGHPELIHRVFVVRAATTTLRTQLDGSCPGAA